MRRHAKASTAGSTMRRARGFGCSFRGAFVTRGSAPGVKGSGAPARHLASLLCLPLALLLAALFAASAQAAPQTIAEFGPELGEGAGEVNTPSGTAVEQATGDLYVSERNNFRVSKFDAEGNFLLAFGYGVAEKGSEELQTCGPEASPPTSACFATNNFAGGDPNNNIVPESVAVDQATGDVYVAEEAGYRVAKFTSAGQLVFIVGRDVNKTKVAEGGATQAEKDFCSAASGDTCGRASSGTAANEFSGFHMGVAVDSAGVVWAGDKNRLISFSSSGVPGAEIALAGAGDTESLALDSSGNFYVKSESIPGVRKLEAGTGALLHTLDSTGFPRTVTVDGEDTVYVGDCGSASPFCPSYRFKTYDAAGAQTYQFGTGEVIGRPSGNAISVGDGAETLYVASSDTERSKSVVQAFPLPEPGPLVEGQRVEDLEPTTVSLAADLNPEGEETTYRFEYGADESYGASSPSETLAAEEFEPETAEAQLEMLTPDTTYHFRVVATSHCNESEPAEECTSYGEDATFTTLPAAQIDRQWATDVGSNSAVFHAELNPLGVAASWWLEYGAGEGYGSSTLPQSLGAGFGDVAVQTLLEDLVPGTTYHYRFAVADERDGAPYTVYGPDREIHTQLNGLGLQLADSRAWEMVSPPNKSGGRIIQSGQGVIQAAADGSGVVYETVTSTEPNPEGNRAIDFSTTLSRRNADGGWHSKDLTSPYTEVTQLRFGGEFKIFSPNLESALLEQQGNTPLSPEASEQTPYLRENTEPATYRPLVTAKEGYANVPEGTVFGGGGSGQSPVAIRATDPELAHPVLRSRAPLVPGAAEGSLYQWNDGQLQPVSELPVGEGGGIIFGDAGAGIGSVHNAVSEDGSRVFWGAGQYVPGGRNFTGLYVRDTVNQESGRLDVAQPGAGEGANRPAFGGASADGSVVYFLDSQRLTTDASSPDLPGIHTFDLYRCEVGPVEGGALGCTSLTDVSAPLEGSSEKTEVIGTVPSVSEDGARAYFIARGVLDPSPNEAGDTAVAGEPNLYLWEEGAGRRFIGTLSEGDYPDWRGTNAGDEEGRAPSLSTSASPDGRYFAFMSQRSLTGYDNRDAKSDEAVEEAFRYDAAEDHLDCISCNPSGASPEGTFSDPSGSDPPRADTQSDWSGRWVAAILPAAPESEPIFGLTFQRPRVVHDNGRVFFNAIDPLVSADANGEWDVYEYEPIGTGDCTSSSEGAAVARSAGGCVSLISSGTSEEEAAFIDASESGDDVFFTTPARLSATDEDFELDVYDARVNGIPATLPVINECLGEACQPAPNPPNDPTPASAAFHGSGNVPSERCPQSKRKVIREGHPRCVAKKHKSKKHSHKKAKRAANKRRAGR